MKYDEFNDAYKASVRKKKTFIAAILAVAIVAGFLEIALGPYDLGFKGYSVLWDHLTGVEPVNEIDDYVIWEKSTPRAIAVVVIGAGLGVCGAAMQSALKNPLADPYMTGIASGASMGVTVAFVLGLFVVPFIHGTVGVAINAFVFAMIPALAIVGISSVKRNAGATTMILIGIAITYVFSAFTTMIKLVASDESYSEVFSWALGSLGSVTWENIPFLLFATGLGIALLYKCHAELNIMAVNEDLAIATGLNPKRARIKVIGIASFVTAIMVCFTGTIGFVGLVGPHIMRIFLGSDNRFLIPASAACGAMVLAVADCLAIEITMTGLPVGVITSLIGGPLFIYILIKQHKKVWA